jgi:hypothetical protein
MKQETKAKFAEIFEAQMKKQAVKPNFTDPKTKADTPAALVELSDLTIGDLLPQSIEATKPEAVTSPVILNPISDIKPDKQHTEAQTLAAKISKLNGVVVEVTGSIVWVTGSTYPNREKLKNYGLDFSAKFKAWFYKF